MQDGSAKLVASRHLVQEGAVREGPQVQQEQRVHHITVVQQVVVVAAQRMHEAVSVVRASNATEPLQRRRIVISFAAGWARKDSALH